MLNLLFPSVAGAWGPHCGRWEEEMHVKWGEQGKRNSQKWSGTPGCIILKTIRMDWNPWVSCRSSCHPAGAQQSCSHKSAKLREDPRGSSCRPAAVHSEWAPGNWQCVRATKTPAPTLREQSLLSSYSPNQGKIPTVFNRSLKSSRNGFLQKQKTLLCQVF